MRNLGKILIIKPPRDCWSNGYFVCKGNNKRSLNKTTLYAHKNKLVANQERIQNGFKNLTETLKTIGFDVSVFNFPKELVTKTGIHSDGVFVRDVGFMFKDYWIQSNFSVPTRRLEAKVYSKYIKKKFNKKIITLPKNAFIEFGEVYYLETSSGSFYFGGLPRANKKGHDFVRKIIKPDKFCLIKSNGYHLDTVFSPVLDSENKLIAVIVAKDMITKESFKKLKKLKLKIICVDKKDSCSDDGLGSYAANCLVGKGVLISGAHFFTKNVEKQLKDLGVKFYVVSLPDFNLSGGSVHCLTNELN